MKKEGWPEFPLFWIEKPNMSSLRLLASHLKEKSEAFRNRYNFPSEPTLMETRIIEHLNRSQQQVLVLTDVVQALLQVIDDQRPSQRVKRAFRWVREKVKEYERKVQESTLYKILTLVGAITTLWVVITLVVRLFHHFRK